MDTLKAKKIMSDILYRHISKSPDDLHFLCSWIAEQPAGQIWCCTGPVGAGKTCMVKQFISQFGANPEVNSPTYSLWHQYPMKNGHVCHHLDLYRLQSLEEFVELDIFESLEKEDVCFIEWPELIETYLEQEMIPFSIIQIEEGPSQREFRILKGITI